MASESPATVATTTSATPAALRPSGAGTSGQRWRTLGWYFLLTGLSLVVLFPVWMGIVRALSDPLPYLQAGIPPWPVHPQWSIFVDAWGEGALGRAFLVSLGATAIIAGAQLVTSTLAAYAFAFLHFPLRRVLFVAVVATLLLPIEVTLVVNTRTIRSWDWLNSLQGLTAPFLATALGIFLLRQGFMGIPRDLRDAAALDGYGHLAFLRKVALPLTRPIVASFALIATLSAWNQYTWPRLTTTDEAWNTLQLRLASLAVEEVDRSNIGYAGAVIAALPILLILIAFQRQLIRGLTAGAVKG